MASTLSNASSRPGTPVNGIHPGSSVTRASLPNYERIFHDKLEEIYGTLSHLKNNRKNYINSKQVYEIYDNFLSLLHELKLSRKDEELKGLTLSLPNSNDLKIDDIWQLLSLCFVTCGLIKFAPATYSSLSTVSKLLGHLKECQVYTLDDLKPIKVRLSEIRDIITYNHDDDEDAIHKTEESLLLRNKLNKCETLYKGLEDNFRNIPKDLEPIYNKLITMRKSIMNYLTNDKSQHRTHNQNEISAKIEQFKGELKKIEARRDEDDSKFHSEYAEETDLDTLQAILNGVIDDCNNLLNDLAIQNDSLSSIATLSIKEEAETDLVLATEKEFESLYTRLVDLKSTLENLLITRRWTLRETDLYTYQKLLKSIDDERIQLNKTLTDQDQQHNRKLRKNHILILYLLRRCYSLIYKLLESSESISESLQPIHNQLSTVRRCLLEIKRIDGLNNLRDLYPFQMKLASLDNLRDDGRFIINGQIPEGQGTLNALLAECFDIMHELQIELEDKDESDDINGGDFTNSKKIETNEPNDPKKNDMDEVEIKRKRYMGFHEADYDKESESGLEEDFDDDDDYDFSDSEVEGNDYY